MSTKDCKTKFRGFVHNFVKQHINELKCSYEDLGVKNKSDLLKQIKSDDTVAYYAFSEIMSWCMGKDYMSCFQCGQTNDGELVFNIKDFYFICDSDNNTIKECEVNFIKVKIFQVKEG